MNANQLKKSILQYAVEGKLTKQNPDFESAQTLIASIEAKKQIMIQNKEIKNEKTVANVITENIPYSLPENWEWATLQSVTSKITDGSHNPPKDSGEGFQIISAKNIIDGSINFDASNRFVSQSDFEKEDKRTNIRRGDLLLCIVGSIGKTAIVDTDIPFTAQRSVAIIKTFIDVNFLKVVVESPFFLEFLLKKSAGTAQKGVYLNTLKEALIPIPPIEEQKRIVKKVNSIFSVLNEYHLNKELLDMLQNEFPKQLEKSILQYAIQGKLVEQDTSDEPASELLKRISEQKERMIKEKIIKKEKPLPPITEEEIPFDIPDTWEWVRVGDVGPWRAGSTPSRSNPLYYSGEIPWIKTGELNDGYIEASNEFISASALKECSLPLNKPGSVLIAMYGATIGKVGILNIPATTNQACCASYPFEGVYNKYLFYYLLSMRNHFRSSAAGGAQPNISKEKLVKTLIPLPPFNEQIRIANKLDEILPLIKNELVF